MALVGLTRATQCLRIHQLSKVSCGFLTEKSTKNASYLLFLQIPCIKHYCTDKKPAIPHRSAAPHATEESKKRKALTSPQITLIGTNEDIQTTTLEVAEKLAKRRNLKLVKIIDFDTKTEKPVFKLMTTTQYFEEDAKAKEKRRNEKQSTVKDAKIFSISSKIGDNDLAIKVKQMSKALTKKHSVRVFVSQDGNPSRAEEIVKIIEDELQEFYSAKENSRKLTTLKLILQPKLDNDIKEANKNKNASKKGKENIEESDKVKAKVN